MKKTLITIISIALTIVAFSEETNQVEYVFDEGYWNDKASIPGLVGFAEVAGIGEFLNQPSVDSPHAIMKVSDYWVGDPGSNVVRIITRNPSSTDWVFPTNTPVVFFAITRGYVLTNNFSDVGNMPPVDTTGIDLTELHFPGGDSAWFRTTRDNGLLYEFATNLWDCIRVNPNQTRFYEVLRDADKVPFLESSRLWLDVNRELDFLFMETSSASLLEKFSDSKIGSKTKNTIHNELLWRGWSCTNGVYYPPPPKSSPSLPK